MGTERCDVSIDTLHKERLVRAFLKGESVTDLSAFYACQRVSIEDVLRESITGLAALNKTLYKQLHPVDEPQVSQLEPQANKGRSDTKLVLVNPVSTAIEG